MSKPKLCAAGIILRTQVNERWPNRDKRTDGWIGDKAHQARQSDHNPDAKGWVRAIDLDADLAPVVGRLRMWQLADQLREYALSGVPGSERIKYLVYRDMVCSGTYKKTFWRWRGKGYGHWDHLHVSFFPSGDTNGARFPLKILGK
jgi:hypothetical protein